MSAAWLDALFKVDPLALAGARIEFAIPPLALAAACALAVLAALAAGGYLRRGARTRGLAWLRGALAVLLVIMLARPEVLLPVTARGEASVMVLLDDSLSMGIADGPGGATRGAQALALFEPQGGALAQDLASRFQVRSRRFSSNPDGLDGLTPVFESAVSDPIGALLDAAADGGVSGIVLVSDGGQVGGRDVEAALLEVRAAGIPVHVVGLGGPGIVPDARVRAVSMPPVALAGDELDLSVWIDAPGFDGESLEVAVRDDGALLARGEARVDGGRAFAHLAVTLTQAGLRDIAVTARAPGGDAVPQNDVHRVALRVRAGPARVLHFEGEPRFEVKFVRRAVMQDPAIALSSLVRTGDNRFLRLGVADPGDLEGGFPDSAANLFAYDVVVLGSVEASAFDPVRLALLEAFVSRRGASVLFLGGRRSLAEGGYGDTPLAGLLPVRLGDADPAYRSAAAVVLTREGARHPVTRGLSRSADIEGARPLPALAVVNPVREVKPGASVLLHGEDGGARPIAMLAWHRFGAGRVAVLPARDTWRWRMHADMAPEDRTHEMFWRGMLRWLARDVPERVALSVTPAVAAPGQSVEFRALVRDADWQTLRDVAPRVEITTPLGEIHSRPMTFARDEEGAFVARFEATDAGMHEVRVVLPGDDGAPARAGAGLLVSAEGEEFRDTGLDEALLRRIATATGGSYRHAGEAAGLAARVAATLPPVREVRRVALWDAPVLLLAMLALAALEWWWRRRRRELP